MNLDQVIYFILLAGMALQRVSELIISKRNQNRMIQRGGYEKSAHQVLWMILLHLAWLIACAWSGIYSKVFLTGALRAQILFILIFCQWIRWQSMCLLGDRWSTRIYVVPGESSIQEGIYSWIRHPNYLIVAIELFVFPLLSWGWSISFGFFILNGVFLGFRIRSEERALIETSDYHHLQDRIKRFHFF